MPFGYALWTFLKNNPAARWAAATLAALVAFFTWLALHDRKVRKGANERATKKAVKVADKIITKMEDQSSDRIEQARKAADAVPADVTSGSVSDRTSKFLFGDG